MPDSDSAQNLGLDRDLFSWKSIDAIEILEKINHGLCVITHKPCFISHDFSVTRRYFLQWLPDSRSAWNLDVLGCAICNNHEYENYNIKKASVFMIRKTLNTLQKPIS